jgi:hypothetical protein
VKPLIKSLVTLALMGLPAWVIVLGVLGRPTGAVVVCVEAPGATPPLVGPVEVSTGEHRIRVMVRGMPVVNRMVAVEAGEQVLVETRSSSPVGATASALFATSDAASSQEWKSLPGYFDNRASLALSPNGRGPLVGKDYRRVAGAGTAPDFSAQFLDLVLGSVFGRSATPGPAGDSTLTRSDQDKPGSPAIAARFAQSGKPPHRLFPRDVRAM